MYESIVITRHGKIAEVALNRPRSYNAFDLEMVTALVHGLTSLATDDTVRGVVITGRGKAFCAGGDLRWAAQSPGKASATFHTLIAQFHLAVLEIRRMEKPVAAAVHGIAAGGGFSLALACDFRVLGASAVLMQGYTSRGLCIDGGGTFTLPRLVGLARALEIAAFDEPIPAEKALQWGLATTVVPDEEVAGEALRLLERIATSPHSFAWSKKLLTDAFETPFEAQLEAERRAFGRCADHPDGQEGLKAFLEKRPPRFGG